MNNSDTSGFDIRASARLIEQNVNAAKMIVEEKEKLFRALLEGYEKEDTTDKSGQQS